MQSKHNVFALYQTKFSEHPSMCPDVTGNCSCKYCPKGTLQRIVNSIGIKYRLMEISLPKYCKYGENMSYCQKARKEAEKINCDRVNPFSTTVSFQPRTFGFIDSASA